MPCLVQTETLFDEDRGLSLKEWAYVWKIQRLCLAIQRSCLVKYIGCNVFDENTKTDFEMFQTDICFLKHLFLSFTGWQNQFYLDFLDQWGLCLANTNICLKTLYKLCACLTLHNIYLSYNTEPLYYQNKASVSTKQSQTELLTKPRYMFTWVCMQLCHSSP